MFLSCVNVNLVIFIVSDGDGVGSSSSSTHVPLMNMSLVDFRGVPLPSWVYILLLEAILSHKSMNTIKRFIVHLL